MKVMQIYTNLMSDVRANIRPIIGIFQWHLVAILGWPDWSFLCRFPVFGMVFEARLAEHVQLLATLRRCDPLGDTQLLHC